MIRVGSLFSGIGGFDVAFGRAGAHVAWASEIDPFALRVYRERFPEVELVGDIAKWQPELRHRVDVVCGGWPCQDLSVAGKREGLDGARSGLFFEAARVVGVLRPTWVFLENVPGLLSSKQGDDFEAVLQALGDLGYGLAWTCIDAQTFGVPQRRRRLFIVGHLGAPCPPEILFESEGLCRDLAPSRKARKKTPGPARRRPRAGRVKSGATEGPEAAARAIGQIEAFEPVIIDEQNASAVPIVGAITTGASRGNRGFAVYAPNHAPSDSAP